MNWLTELYQIYTQYSKVITDSRKIESGCIFFALKGPNFNGNQYADDALARGAAYAVVDEAFYADRENTFLVQDCLTALQELARYHRQQFTIPVLAITGSNGKTTTKELINAVCSSHYRTHYTKGNLNNHIGVPLTLLEMPLDTELAIIEMGANHVGDIDFLCNIVLPTHGLITNIGKAHLEGFKSLEGVKQGKSELYRHLQSRGGMLFVNQDENYLSDLSENCTNRLLYGSGQANANDQSKVTLIRSHPFVQSAFWSQEDNLPVTVYSHLMGSHNFNNIMTAIVVGCYFKVPAIKIKQGIENYQPTNNRSQLVQQGTNVFLMDAYNANPDSMRKALNYFSAMPAANRIAILGDMLELGEYSEAEHEAIVDLALQSKLSKIFLVGPSFGKTTQQSSRIFRFKDVAELKDWYTKYQETNTHFLLKGSRGIRLETFLSTT
jgi:UDP-N-acetylmuramoyl-tripeptide--D-alanyl-D-alanine ligase